LGTAATTGLLYQPRMIGEGDCGDICGIKIGRGNRSSKLLPRVSHEAYRFKVVHIKPLCRIKRHVTFLNDPIHH
jgi:hypothetical protein